MKYGIMYYKETDNIGDDIQTYTAIKFLPHIDYYIDREDLNCFLPNKKEYVSIILNGWFMHNKAAWPPSPYINPLLLSMHFTSLEKIDVGENYLKGLGGEYLKKFQPIGCRDIETQKRLDRNNIENYFSGCMTLTIEPFDNIEKKQYICIVDLDEDSAKLVRKYTNREIKEITHDVNPMEIKNKSFDERMKNVEKLLKTYQAAHIVLTNRLHVALPCIALGTPVILVHKENFEKDRLGTYLEYINSYSDTDFAKQDIREIIENPPQNKNKYCLIRNSLIKKCKYFIEYCEKNKEKEEFLPEIEEYSKYVEKIRWYKQLYEELRVNAKKNIYEAEKRYEEYQSKLDECKEEYEKVLKQNKEQKNIEEDLKEKNKKLTEELEMVYNSRGWKYLEKIRKFKRRKNV